MKNLIILVIIVAIGAVGFFVFNDYIYNQKQAVVLEEGMQSDVAITPISHATMVLSWNGKVIYVDPVGGVDAFAGQPTPDLILVTDIHGDHLSIETLEAVVGENTTIYAPQAVADEMPSELRGMTDVINNGQVFNWGGSFAIQAVPMYNIPESDDAFHVKGRGNGYVIESTGTRVYIAGDTADTPEMRAMQDIDIAFVPMNLPYTMPPIAAADAVLEFKPKKVYPYHFRQPDGFADVDEFERVVTEGDPEIEVVRLNWYQ